MFRHSFPIPVFVLAAACGAGPSEDAPQTEDQAAFSDFSAFDPGSARRLHASWTRAGAGVETRSDLAVVAVDAHTLHVFYRDKLDNLVRIIETHSSADDRGTFGVPALIGSGLTSGVSAVLHAGEVQIFGRGPANQLIQWTCPMSGDPQQCRREELGGLLEGKPAAVANGRLDVFVRGTDGKLHHRGNLWGWGPWENIAVDYSGEGVAVSHSNGELSILARQPDGMFAELRWSNPAGYYYTQIGNPNYWSNWIRVAGFISGAPAAVVDGSGRIHALARGTDGQTYQITRTGYSWAAGWSLLGVGCLGTSPAMAYVDENRTDVLAAGRDMQIRHNTYGTNRDETIGDVPGPCCGQDGGPACDANTSAFACANPGMSATVLGTCQKLDEIAIGLEARKQSYLWKSVYGGCDKNIEPSTYHAIAALTAIKIGLRGESTPPPVPTEPGHAAFWWNAELAKSFFHVDTKRDTADFHSNAMLRLLYLHYNEIPNNTRNTMIQSLLGFKYWVDEAPVSLDMTYWSENHHILFHASELLAGQLLEHEFFPMAGIAGRDHVARAKPRLHRWLDDKLKHGFAEWNSSVYYEQDISALLNVIDFAQDQELREKAAMVLDIIFFDLARFTHNGSFGVTAGRNYADQKLSGREQTVGETIEILFGTRGYCLGGSSDAAISLLTSSYQVPHALIKVGQDRPARSIDRTSVGINIEDGPANGIGYTSDDDVMYWWSHGAFATPELITSTRRVGRDRSLQSTEVIVELSNYFFGFDSMSDSALLDRARLMHPFTSGIELERANLYTYRNKDVMLSSVQSYKPGAWFGPQIHTWQATIDSDAVLFSNQPGDQERNGPGEWTGSAKIPHVVQRENALIVAHQYDDDLFCLAPAPLCLDQFLLKDRSHVYFPIQKFDEFSASSTESCDNCGGWWFYGRKNKAYVGVFVPRSFSGFFSVSEDGDCVHSGNAIECDVGRNVFVVQVGNEEEFGSYDNFRAKTAAARLHVSNLDGGDIQVSYQIAGMNNAQLELHFGDKPRFFGQEYDDQNFQRFEGPYANVARGARTYTISHGGFALDHELDQNRRFGAGIAGLQPRRAVPTATGAKLISGDFDGDGRSDLALIGGLGARTLPIAFFRPNSTIEMFDGPWHHFVEWASAPGVKILSGDFNGDGKSDLALTGGPGWWTIPVAFSDGSGRFAVKNSYAPDFPGWAATPNARAVVADFNRDGRDDIALAGGANWTSMPVAFSTGDGGFEILNALLYNEFPAWAAVPSAQFLSAGGSTAGSWPSLAFVGGAGWTTVAWGHPLFFGGTSYWFSTLNQFDVGSFGGWAATPGVRAFAGDFDRDGFVDLGLAGAATWTSVPVAFTSGASSSRVAWVANEQAHELAAAAKGSRSQIVVGNFDGVGGDDLAITQDLRAEAVLLGLSNGNGSFRVERRSAPEFAERAF